MLPNQPPNILGLPRTREYNIAETRAKPQIGHDTRKVLHFDILIYPYNDPWCKHTCFQTGGLCSQHPCTLENHIGNVCLRLYAFRRLANQLKVDEVTGILSRLVLLGNKKREISIRNRYIQSIRITVPSAIEKFANNEISSYICSTNTCKTFNF